MKKLIFYIFLAFGISLFSQTTPGEYEIKNLQANSKKSDFGPAYSVNNQLIFSSSRGNAFGKKWEGNNQPFLDLYQADINEDGSLSNLKDFSNTLNSKYHESSVSYTPDFKTVYFTRNNEIDGDAKQTPNPNETERQRKKRLKEEQKNKTTYLALYKAEVDSKGKWFNIKPLPFNNRNYSVGHPAVSRDGKKLYFTSDMPGTYGGTDIFVVNILGNNEYSKPKNLGRKINTLGREMFPFIDKKNILYFASDSRKGGLGGLDIYAIRIYENSMSDAIHLGVPINSEADDFAIILNNDIDEGYFSSNRKSGKGDDDIYHFTASPPLNIECTQPLSGIVKNAKTEKPLFNATVEIIDASGNVLKSTKTNKRGKYKFDVLCDSNFRIVATKFKFIEDGKNIITKNNPSETHKVDLELTPEVICNQELIGIVKNKNNQKTISNAMVSVLDKSGKEILTASSSQEGTFKFSLPCNKNYTINGSKEKYENDTKSIITTEKPKHKLNLELLLKPIIDTTEIKIVRNKVIVNINPIYFELDKSRITKTAAIELDKVVAIMKKYPKLRIEGGSHTDSRGTKAYNDELSARRANSTIVYIIKNGIDPSRITAKGYGESQPVNRCVDGVRCTKAEYAENRRTEFVILNPEELGYIE